MGKSRQHFRLVAATTMIAAIFLSAGDAADAQQTSAYTLDELIQLTLDRNPRLQRAALSVDAAQGRALQAGLYPNPTISFTGEEIGPNGGIQTLPQIKQEIVTAGKRKLDRAVANQAVDQASLALLQQRYSLMATVRMRFYEVLAVQRRIGELQHQVAIAKKSYDQADGIRKGGQFSEVDLLPFDVALEQLNAQLEAAKARLEASWQKLTSDMGAPDLPLAKLATALDAPLPHYDLDIAREFLLERHPAIQSARVGITKAQFALRRAEVQKFPNVTLSGGYQRNFNDDLNQATYGIQVPIPLFNRNQGNVRAAQAELARAVHFEKQVEYALLNNLAAAFANYAAAKERAERYGRIIVPKAERAYELSIDALKGGKLEKIFFVFQNQRTLANANLFYIQSLAEAWQAAAQISGLLLEEHWPHVVMEPAKERNNKTSRDREGASLGRPLPDDRGS